MTGKTVRLHMVDGYPTGIITAEIINWTGKVIVAPRSQLSALAKRDEVRRTGVYLLVGPDPEDPVETKVYVGEADSVINRLIAHDKDEKKDFFSRIAVVTSKDANITKSHGRYLESRLIAMVRSAARATLANGTGPDPPTMPEPDVADMEYFLQQLELVLPVVSMNVLQPKPKIPQGNGEMAADSPRFVLEQVGATARAIELDGDFVVLKGSTARKQGTKGWTSYKRLRDRLISEGVLIQSDEADYYVFKEDIAVSSPSAGGSLVCARNTNGRTSWKVESTGQSYAQWQDEKLAGLIEEDDV